jgi:NADH:ubiquinone oxidoreductase subunit 4 (subunit M)
MSIFILIFVVVCESSFFLIMMGVVLVFFCFFFFLPVNLFSFYIFFEISMFPVLFIILGAGNQIEKVGAAYFLFFYSTFCSFPFLILLFFFDNVFCFIYFDVFFC